jgi:formate dehydrogenase assembly factor FdhD
MEALRVVPCRIWREDSPGVGNRSIPEETAVALTYDGRTYAVMMATPRDLEDFAVGFSLSEGIIASSADIHSPDVLRLDDGVELQIWLSKPKADRLGERRRHIAMTRRPGLPNESRATGWCTARPQPLAVIIMFDVSMIVNWACRMDRSCERRTAIAARQATKPE